ncbi:MAG: molybdate ABC transporter substrate-binding protein [Cyclobacteriaceae bacterium]
MIILSILSCSTREPRTMTIAAAANVQYAIDSLVSVFELDTGTDCEVVISSSGKLTAQISKGAPYDIFLSADMRYPKTLFDNGLLKNEPIIYAQGSLVLWGPTNIDSDDLWKLLRSDEMKYIAIANPKTAPYGIAAMEALSSMKLMDVVADKLIYGESIAQTNHFITSGAAGLGFTAKSVVMTRLMKDKGYWLEVDPNHYVPIDQGMAIINHEGYELPAAQIFYDFMLSPKAQSILKYFGYQSPS